MDPVLQLASRLAVAALFALAAAHKLRAAAQFRAQLAAYRLLPDRLVGVASWALPLAELAIAAALLVPAVAAPAAAAAAGLLSLYSAAIAINLRRGRSAIDCGCGGRGTPLSQALVLRNAALLVVVVAAGSEAQPRPLVWLDAVTIASATGASLLLFHAAALAAGGRAARTARP